LKGKTVFYHHWERMKQCKNVDKIYLATSKNTSNTPLIENARECGVPYYAGAEEDVIQRFIRSGKSKKQTFLFGAHATNLCLAMKLLIN